MRSDDLIDNLHANQVLVDLDNVDPVLSGELDLVGHNLPVLGLELDANLEALMLHLLHVLGGLDWGGQGGHVHNSWRNAGVLSCQKPEEAIG